MKILAPEIVTEAMLTSINIPENDHSQWANGSTYARSDLVISTTTHSVYRSLTDGNQGNNPDLEMAALADPLVEDPSPVNWQLIGATNRWRVFDQKPSRLATYSGPIVIDLAPGFFVQGIAGFGVKAETVQVQVFAGAELLYDRTVEMLDESGVTDWTLYYTQPFSFSSEFVLTDLPILGTPRIVITLDGPGQIEVGQIVIGRMYEIGAVKQDGTGFSGLDFSAISVNEYGDLETVQRPAARLFDYNLFLLRNDLSNAIGALNQLRGGVAAVWIATEDTRLSAIGYGFYRGYRTVYLGADHAEIAIEVQGVV